VPKIGEKFSQYTIISVIGSGGMGEVFLAEDAKLGRKTALKFLSREFASDREHLERFVREARAASALNHPNICTIYEINDAVETPFIAMEYVDGETVVELIRRKGRNLGHTVDISLQVAEALAEAHSHGVVHRDIKPANIVINKKGRVKILDFGLAKRMVGMEAAEGQFQTHAGVVLGTASYMSPEQARGLEVDQRSDIWSLGVCMYEMLTGSLPFRGDTAADTFAAILTYQPDPPSRHCPEVPEALDRLILNTIERQREKRLGSMDELIDGLRSIKQRIETASGRADGERTNEPTEIFHSAPTERSEPLDTDEDLSAHKTAPHNLTESFERIIGRELEIASLCEMLAEPQVRLVTMTGIGGTGKTTLSRAVARRMLPAFEHGVFFIEMADVFRSDVVASTIAKPLGIREEGGRPVIEVLKDHLRNKEILLVIDNFEQVVDAAPQINELLLSADRLKILVTSREVLRLTSEVEFQVPPLTLPDPETATSFDELSETEAVTLFVERAKTARSGFTLARENIEDVVAICSLLDGLPLAIELAAARIRILSPAALRDKLEKSLDLLAGVSRDRPERQRTMRGAVLWSYELLSPQEKQVFRELSVFSGGFRFDSAESVCQTSAYTHALDLVDVISSLIDKSLLIQKESKDGEPRFRMLEVVRGFALELLGSEGDLDSTKRRHAECFVGLGEAAEPQIQGASSDVWLSRLAEEHDNIRAAMDWGLANAPDLAVRLAVSVRNYWLVQSHLSEGFGWLKAAASSGFDPPASLRFKLLNGLGLSARFRGDYDTARRAYEDGLAAGIEAGDKSGTALSHRGLGLVSMQQGDLEAARVYFDAGLAISRELDDKYGIAMSLSFLGDLARTEGKYADARPHFEEAVELFRRLENRTAVSDALNNLGAALVCLGETERAAKCFEEAIRSARELSNRITISCSLDGFAAVAERSGDLHKAAVLSGAAEGLRELIGYKIEPAESKFREFYLSKLGERLDPEELNVMVDQGRRLGVKEAVSVALRIEPAGKQPAVITRIG
jgi:non-specific serine/threonine protein kinase